MVGGACGTHGKGEKKCTKLRCESPRERDQSKDLGVDGRVRLEWTLLGRLAGGVEWIQLAQFRDRWRAIANAVMKLFAYSQIRRQNL
jgi:hypothetical protein